MRVRQFLIWSAPTAGLLAAGLALPPSLGRFVAVVLAFWFLPGWALARGIERRIGLSILERAVVVVVAPLLVFGYVATPLALLRAHPAWVGISGIVVAAVMLLRQRDAATASPARGPLGTRTAVLVLLVAVGLALLVTHFQPMSGVTSDANAHIAATNAALQEREIFPRHEFYADEADAGPDPRFGVLHAWYAALAWWAGVEAADVWGWLAPLGSWLWITALAALSAAVCRSGRGFAMAWLLFLGSYIGTISNPLAFSVAPFYVGFATVLTAVGVAWRVAPRAVGAVVAAVAVVGVGQMHAMPFLLGSLLLGAAFLVDREGRRRWLRGLVILAALGVPWMFMRFLLSYSAANPINAWPFQIVTWGGSLKGASPDFLLARVSWPGLMVLLFAPLLWELRRRPEGRWLMLLCFGLLAWVIFPPTFALSWALVSLLTLRLTMAILFPLVWGLWVEMPATGMAQRPFVRWSLIALLVLLGGVGLVNRVRPGGDVDSANDFQRLPEWEELIDVVRTSIPAESVILSDPFTMLSLRARLPQHVVAVPGGRSSPRDSAALQRLRDTSGAMNAHGDPIETEHILQSYGVTHIVLNQAFKKPLADIECEIDPRSFPAQRAKFERNPGVFEPMWHEGDLWLFEVRAGERFEDPTYFRTCVEPVAEDGIGRSLSGGFALKSARLRSAEVHAGGHLELNLGLTYCGEGQAPHRRLAVRLDSTESPVPRLLSVVAKPVRKLIEKSTGRKWRARWNVSAGAPGCVSSQLRTGQVMFGEHRLAVPANLAPGRYELTVQAVRMAPFNVPDVRDFLRDDDYYRGSVAATVEVLPPLSEGAR